MYQDNAKTGQWGKININDWNRKQDEEMNVEK